MSVIRGGFWRHSKLSDESTGFIGLVQQRANVELISSNLRLL